MKRRVFYCMSLKGPSRYANKLRGMTRVTIDRITDMARIMTGKRLCYVDWIVWQGSGGNETRCADRRKQLDREEH